MDLGLTNNKQFFDPLVMEHLEVAHFGATVIWVKVIEILLDI